MVSNSKYRAFRKMLEKNQGRYNLFFHLHNQSQAFFVLLTEGYWEIAVPLDRPSSPDHLQHTHRNLYLPPKINGIFGGPATDGGIVVAGAKAYEIRVAVMKASGEPKWNGHRWIRV